MARNDSEESKRITIIPVTNVVVPPRRKENVVGMAAPLAGNQKLVFDNARLPALR